MKILVVEDDDVLSEVLRGILEANGFAVDLTGDGQEGLYMAEQFSPDAIILDVILPRLDGVSVVKRLRETGHKTPILLLTTKGDVQHRIEGLNCGADDYLPKPFDHGEFLARLRAILRRGKNSASALLTAGELEVDMAGRTVKRSGRPIELTAKEFNLLEYLILNKERVVTRGELFSHLYHSGYESESNLIDVYITFLRNKIDKPYPVKLIHTVRGAGYVLKSPEPSS